MCVCVGGGGGVVVCVGGCGLVWVGVGVSMYVHACVYVGDDKVGVRKRCMIR